MHPLEKIAFLRRGRASPLVIAMTERPLERPALCERKPFSES